MIFKSKLHVKSVENLIFDLLEKPHCFYDNRITNGVVTHGGITVKIRLIQ